MGTFSRTIRRKIARTNMENAGIKQMNKKKYKSDDGTYSYSFFSKHWRGFAFTK